MTLKPDILQKLKSIVENKYSHLTITLMGKKPTDKSVIEQIYEHNFEGEGNTPISSDSKELLKTTFKNLIEKQKADTLNKLEAILREYKLQTRLIDKVDLAESLKTESLAKLKVKFRDMSGESTRNWDRIVNTEVSNAIGLGSADKIIENCKNPHETYVYRINPNDSRTCNKCREFYIDKDGSPKLYRLSTIVGNGSNYGKRKESWKACTMSTHPNCRDSQIIELKPGFKLGSGGTVTYIGHEEWPKYLASKLIK